MYRLGDMLLELRDPETPQQRVDEIVRELNELGDREERYRNILTVRGIIVENVETPDGSVRIAPGQFFLGNGVRPGEGYSGIRMEYPAFEMDGEEWNLAGVENDTLQFGVRASDGKAVAGGGAVILDEDGIQFPDGGDGTEYIDDQHETRALIGFRTFADTATSKLETLVYQLDDALTRISNGNFATGDFTSWTETDPDGKVSVVEVDRGYAAYFNNNLSSATHYISQNLSETAEYGFVVKAKVRSAGGSIYAGTTTSTTQSVYIASDNWRTVTFVIDQASASNVKITMTGTGYITDIEVYELKSSTAHSLFSVSPQTSILSSYLVRIGRNDEIRVTQGSGVDIKSVFAGRQSITANDNVVDLDFSTCWSINISASAATTLRGLGNSDNYLSQDRRVILLLNVSGFTVTLKHRYGSTSATDFFCPNSTDYALSPGAGVWIQYHHTPASPDGSNSFWRVIG